MSAHGASITTVLPDKHCIPWKIKKKKLSEISITGNKITQEPDKPSKKAKMDSSIDDNNNHLKKPPPYKNNQDYVGGNNYKTHEYNDSQSDTDGFARNIDDEHKNEENGDYIEPLSEKNDRIKSKLEEDVRNSLLAKTIHSE